MADLISDFVERLLRLDLEPVPRYRLLRDVCSLPSCDHDLQKARDSLWSSRPVLDLLGQQQADGSWGRFYSRNKLVKNAGRTTETAIIRALALGLERDHPAMQHTVNYLASLLRCERPWPDQIDDFGDMKVAHHLIAAARLRSLDPDNAAALQVARQWTAIIMGSFDRGEFAEDRIEEVSEAVLGEALPTNCYLCFSVYSLLLLRDQLPWAIERSWVAHLMQRSRGIAYLNNHALHYLPLAFPSQEGMRYLSVLDHLGWYTTAAELLEAGADWLWDQQVDGWWDFGPIARDGLELPLSNSWRTNSSRLIDCTVRALVILARLQRTCSIQPLIGHGL